MKLFTRKRAAKPVETAKPQDFRKADRRDVWGDLDLYEAVIDGRRVRVRNLSEGGAALAVDEITAPDRFAAEAAALDPPPRLSPAHAMSVQVMLSQLQEADRPYAVFRANAVCEFADGKTCRLPAEATVWLSPALMLRVLTGCCETL